MIRAAKNLRCNAESSDNFPGAKANDPGRAWLGVVSRAHVQRGVCEGFSQLCHGKAEPLRRMRTGDWLVYYSPALEMGGAPLKAFTALGRVRDDEVFAFDMGEGFVPYRRKIEYFPVREVKIEALKDRLLLCSRPNWGMTLRRGHIRLEWPDFELIARQMGIDWVALK